MLRKSIQLSNAKFKSNQKMKLQLIDLTVFIISVGEDTSDECEEALTNQDCIFTIKRIRDTFPMSSAFQRMPDECETKYFVQVDSDMILEPTAIQTLYNGIKRSLFMTYMVYGQLHEDGVGISGAVKCWKSWLFNYFQFRDCRTVDRDIYSRTRWFGLRYKGLDKILGLHHARLTPFTRYLKTKSDIEKRRFLKISYKRHDVQILNKSIDGLPETGSELFGAMLGVLTPRKRLVRSKDNRLEVQRYSSLMCHLGLNESLPEIRNLKVNITELKNLFYKSYKNISDNQDNRRLALAGMVVNIFSRKSNASSSEVLKILSR